MANIETDENHERAAKMLQDWIAKASTDQLYRVIGDLVQRGEL